MTDYLTMKEKEKIAIDRLKAFAQEVIIWQTLD